MTPRGHHQKTNYILNLNNFSVTSLMYNPKVSLDRVHQDLNLYLWEYPPKGVRTWRTQKSIIWHLRQILLFLNGIQFLQHILLITTIFLVKLFCQKKFDNTGEKHKIHLMDLLVDFFSTFLQKFISLYFYALLFQVLLGIHSLTELKKKTFS